MTNSFKNIDLGYSKNIESSIFENFKNNDKYLYNKLLNNTKYLYAYQHTGSLKWNGTDDFSFNKVLNVSKKLTFKNDTVYLVRSRIRTVSCEEISAGFTFGYWSLNINWETSPVGYAGVSGGISHQVYMNGIGYYNGMQQTSYFYVRGGSEDFESSLILYSQLYCDFDESFSGSIDSYSGSPIEYTVQELGPIRLWL